jgi:hypothetical protein
VYYLKTHESYAFHQPSDNFNMKFNQYIQFRALSAKANIEGQSFNSDHTEGLIEKAAANHPNEFKTVCAPISLPLFDRLTNTLSILDISKRAFIESAIVEALDQADQIMAEVDVFEGVPPSAAQASGA